MGKGPKYIALSLLILGLMAITGAGLMAQEGPELVAPLDSNLHGPHDSSNIVIKKDTVTQSLASFAHDSADSITHVGPGKKYLHSARKAAYLSAVLPGLGQAYNKRYWKIPIIYAGLGGLAYAMYYTSYNFNGYRTVDREQKAINPNPYASFNGVSDPASVQAYQAYFKKYLDISAIGLGVWYLLNIVDATVDAHLMTWNMKDDLSVSWNPTLITTPNYNSAAAGLAFTLHF